jgi:hypothetical protein
MKEKILICLTGLLLGTNHGCFTTNPNQSVLQCNGNIPLHLQPKSLRLRVCPQLKHNRSLKVAVQGLVLWPIPYTYMPSAGKILLIVFGDSQWVLLAHFQKCGKNVNSASHCEVLFEALGCSSQKTSMPTGKRGAASSWHCQTPYSPSNPGENSRTAVGTSWTSALQPRLGL